MNIHANKELTYHFIDIMTSNYKSHTNINDSTVTEKMIHGEVIELVVVDLYFFLSLFLLQSITLRSHLEVHSSFGYGTKCDFHLPKEMVFA